MEEVRWVTQIAVQKTGRIHYRKKDSTLKGKSGQWPQGTSALQESFMLFPDGFLSLFFCLVDWSIDRLIFFVIYLIYPGFATSSHSLELMIFLPLSLRCCDYRCDHKLCSVFLLELLQTLQSSWYKRRESATAIRSPYRNYDHRPEEHLMVTQHKLSVIFIHSQNWDFLAIMMMFSWI